jgi:hypothetical protein
MTVPPTVLPELVEGHSFPPALVDKGEPGFDKLSQAGIPSVEAF